VGGTHILARKGKDISQLKPHPLTHPLICKHPLSTSQEQERTLQLERERNGEGIEREKEEEEKYQHLPMDSINIFNIVMVSSRE